MCARGGRKVLRPRKIKKETKRSKKEEKAPKVAGKRKKNIFADRHKTIVMLIPLQGDFPPRFLPRVLPWAMCYCPVGAF